MVNMSTYMEGHTHTDWHHEHQTKNILGVNLQINTGSTRCYRGQETLSMHEMSKNFVHI